MRYVVDRIKKLIGFVSYDDKYAVKNYSPLTHKDCPECDGSGRADVFVDCEVCKGTGIIRKNYQEYVESLSDVDNK